MYWSLHMASGYIIIIIIILIGLYIERVTSPSCYEAFLIIIYSTSFPVDYKYVIEWACVFVFIRNKKIRDNEEKVIKL